MYPKCNLECKTLRNCGALNNHGFVCTRRPGHEGDHVACGTFSEHDLCVWPQETSAPTPTPPQETSATTIAHPLTGKALFYATVEKALEEYAHKRHMPRKDIVTLLHEHLVQKYTR